MCGLILAPSSYPIETIGFALNRMKYRGDGRAPMVATRGAWSVGHVRLAIQDLSTAGDQPFPDFHGRRTIAFVGEFFTHNGQGEKEYVEQLLADPPRFHEADGFWSIVRAGEYDAEAYTDHLGIKPLYYWPKYNIVCSEIEPMFALETPPELDETYLSNCIKFGYDYSGRTPYKGICQLAPGTCLRIVDGRPYFETYWKWHLVRQDHRSLREVVEEAIFNRLVSDVPVAMLLSGGLDSSIIYHTLKNADRQVRAFSIENGESEFLPDDVVFLPRTGVDPPEALRVLKAPLDLGSMLPQVELAKAMKGEGFNVCLTGDGADEVFGGYRRAKQYDSQKSDVFCELPYYHMPRLDRVMMRATIELRSPYLAPAVVAFGLRLPYPYRQEKQALKSAFRGIVPDRIIDRPKHPLKSAQVIGGGIEYRRKLVEDFRHGYHWSHF